MTRQSLIIALFLGIVVVVFCCFAYSFIAENHQKELGGQIFEGIGALFSGLAFIGIIFTIFLQSNELQLQRKELEYTRIELKKTAEANLAIVQDNKELSVFELYKEFKSAYLQDITKSAWRIFINCLKSKTYCDYFLNTYYCVDYTPGKFTQKIANEVESSYPSTIRESLEELTRVESDDRYKLDYLINFFQILSFRLNSEFMKKCDFYYDWWRPLLWWLADIRLNNYNTDGDKQEYCIKPNLTETLLELDKIYGFKPLNNSTERWEYLKNHPLLKKVKIDVKLESYYQK